MIINYSYRFRNDSPHCNDTTNCNDSPHCNDTSRHPTQRSTARSRNQGNVEICQIECLCKEVEITLIYCLNTAPSRTKPIWAAMALTSHIWLFTCLVIQSFYLRILDNQYTAAA
jgi:hypothetical protein